MNRGKKRNGVLFFLVFIISISLLIPCSTAETATINPETAVALTEEEQHYIKANPTVSIAIDTSWMPYGFQEQDGSCAGIIPNIMGMIAERVGLKASFIPKDTYAAAINAGASGETMLVSGIADDPEMLAKNDVLITDPYITIGYSAVTKKDLTNLYASGADYRVALCVGTYAKMAMEKRMPTYMFREYHSNQACIDAVAQDEADIALIANYSAGFFSNLHEYDNLQVIQINDFSWGLCFGVNKNVDPILIGILNKGIASLSENDINQAIYLGATEATSSAQRFTDIFYKYPAASIAIIILIAIILVFVILRRKKAQEKRYQEALNEKDLLLNSIPAGIGVFVIEDKKSKERLLNDSFYRLIDDSRENHNKRTGQNFINGVFEEDKHLVIDSLSALFNGQDRIDITFRALKPDGSTTWLNVIGLAADRSQNRVTLYCSFSCVDHEVSVRQKLQESSNIVEAAMLSAHMMVWTYDINEHKISQILSSLPQHRFGEAVENVPESLIENGYIHPEFTEKFRRLFQAILTSSEPIYGDFLIQNADGAGYLWERLILTPVIENKRLTKVIGTSANINALKEKEDQYWKLMERMQNEEDVTLIAKGQYNLSKNINIYYSRMADYSLEFSDSFTFDTALEKMVLTAVSLEDQIKIGELLNRNLLIESYYNGKKDGSFKYKRTKENCAAFWSLVKYSMFEEPNSGDIIFFVYTYDITENEREQKMLSKLGAIEYDVLGLIDVQTHHFEKRNVKGIISLNDSDEQYSDGLFEDIFHRQILSFVRKDKQPDLEKRLSFEVILGELANNESYSIQLTSLRKEGSPRRKQLNFTYLDESKTTVFYYLTDITKRYQREQEQLKMAEDALELAR